MNRQNSSSSAVTLMLLQREIIGGVPQQPLRYSSRSSSSVALRHVPNSLSKEQARFPCESSFDKIFTSKWIDEDTIAFGTKCNRLCLWSPLTRSVRVVSLPRLASTRRPSVQHAPSTALVGNPPQTISANEIEAEGDPTLACGIHDLDTNASKTSLICGSHSPCDVAVFKLQAFSSSSIEPMALLHGHPDWVFASKFLSDEVIVTGSRDGSVKIWRLPSALISQQVCDYDTRIPTIDPINTKTEHEDKEFITLSGDTTVKIWDNESASVKHEIKLNVSKDLVALASSPEHHLIAIGSQAGTLLYDERTMNQVKLIPAIGSQWGVRCVTFNKDVLTIGGGSGTIGFYDLRQNEMRLYGTKSFAECSSGYLHNSHMFEIDEMPQAVYTVQYDALNTRIFVGGGPLMCGFCGCYGAVWG